MKFGSLGAHFQHFEENLEKNKVCHSEKHKGWSKLKCLQFDLYLACWPKRVMGAGEVCLQIFVVLHILDSTKSSVIINCWTFCSKKMSNLNCNCEKKLCKLSLSHLRALERVVFSSVFHQNLIDCHYFFFILTICYQYYQNSNHIFFQIKLNVMSKLTFKKQTCWILCQPKCKI